MMKTIPMLMTILISSLAILTPTNANIGFIGSSDRGVRSSWSADSHRQRVDLFKKWLGNKPPGSPMDNRAPSSPFNMLDPTHAFKGTSFHRRKKMQRRTFQ